MALRVCSKPAREDLATTGGVKGLGRRLDTTGRRGEGTDGMVGKL